MMAKIKFSVGRKRRQGVKRQPDGRPVPDKGIDPKAIAQLMPHRRLVPADVAHDPKAESIMGRLALNGHISEVQYQAGVKYRTLVMNYRRVISAPSANEASMAGVIVGPWGRGGEMTDERAVEIRNSYMRAFEALEENGKFAREVAHCAVYDRANFTLGRLRLGLDALAIHFGLTNAGKFANGINRR